MSIDRADWHYGGDFPKDLPKEAGGTHIGVFLAWIIENDLIGDIHREHSSDGLKSVKSRSITGNQFLFDYCDSKFTDEDLNEEGLAFTSFYYGDDSGYKQYLSDYERTLANRLPSLYHVHDTWENFDRISPIISKRYHHWKHPKKWWNFWKG